VRHLSRHLLWLALALVTACDSKAKATDPQGGGARPEQKSKEYESCGASLHCQDDLRCFEGACRRTARSIVGDYHVAAGRAAATRGDLEAAVTAFATAVGQYDAEKVAVPPDVECAYGATLAAARGKADYAERAAKVLHRCVLAVPAASALRERALAHLASLADSGLDPLLLGSTKPADIYLTKGAAAPSTDKLQITFKADPQPAGKQWAKVDKLATELRSGLIGCWKKGELVATLEVKVGFATNPDYEEEGSWFTKVEPGSSPDAACVHAVLEPAIKKLKLAERVDSKLTITIR
jgi:hypothetical protein